jgi:hypothetical protein
MLNDSSEYFSFLGNKRTKSFYFDENADIYIAFISEISGYLGLAEVHWSSKACSDI